MTLPTDGEPTTLKFGPAGRTLACGYKDGAVKVWSLLEN
jgi:hypothetical protein